ncbi:MAG: hypothetical protein ACQETL_14205 [Bacteroidota bacterium]
MKNIILLLISSLMISCSTQKVLKTDTQQDIDLSGRWNDTDAEIVTSELFNSLITSSWLKEHKTNSDIKPRLEILEFEENFKGSGEVLRNYFVQYAKEDSSLEFISSDEDISPDFQLSGKITAEEFITDSQNHIDYIIRAQLKDMDGKVHWQDNTTIKKYIKD